MVTSTTTEISPLAAFVAQQCPQDVDPAAGQGDDGLGVGPSVAAYVIAETLRSGGTPWTPR